MRIRLLIILMLIAGINFGSIAQDQRVKSKIVKKAYHADKTPALRDMKVIAPYYRDRSWKNFVIKNPSVEMSFENNQGSMLAPIYDPTMQMNNGSRTARGPEVNIAGITNVNGVYPPDTDGDVGPNHYVQMINLSFAIWDKEGTLLYGPVDNSTLWQGFVGPWTGTNDGDPIILYDDMADRWIASQFAVNVGNGKYYELVAVSATPDPLGEWYRYAFEYDVFVDYPKLGVWSDAYYMTTNNFNGGFEGIGVHAFEREKMLAGDPEAQVAYFELSSWAGFSMQPADCDGIAPPEGEPGLFVTKGGDNDLDVYAFVVDWDNSANTSFDFQYSIPVSSYSSNISSVSQPNTTQELDALASMLMYRMQYRNMGDHQAVVLNHTVRASGVAGIRWYELRKTDADWELYQEGTFAPGDGLNRWMGSIAMNANGDIALGYTVSNSLIYPSIRYTGRAATDPLGEMTFGEIEAVSGTGSQSNINRWGDYSNTSVDPSNDSIFWHTNEYLESGWRTRIFSFTFGPPKAPEIYAGPDTTICENDMYKSQSATGEYYQSLYWTTTGNGRFLPNNTELVTNYLRGSEDIENGTVTLDLFATGYGETGEVTDQMVLSIARLPSAAAGNDTTICNDEELLVTGSVENTESSEWITEGDGYFEDPMSLTTVYHPGTADIAEGKVKLRLFGYAVLPCDESQNDYRWLYLSNCVGIDNNQQELAVSVKPNPVKDKLNLDVNATLSGSVITLSDARGKLIFTMNTAPGEDFHVSKDVSNLPNGVYLLKIRSGQALYTEKIIKQ